MHLPIKMSRVGRTPVNKILRFWSNWSKKGEVPVVKWRRHYRRKSQNKPGAPKPHFSASFTTVLDVLELWCLNFFFFFFFWGRSSFSNNFQLKAWYHQQVISWENWGDISQNRIAGPQLWFSYPELKLEVTTKKQLQSCWNLSLVFNRDIVLLPSSLFSPYFWCIYPFCMLSLFFI